MVSNRIWSRGLFERNGLTTGEERGLGVSEGVFPSRF